MLDSKKQFSITLTEPVAFLRSSDPSGRHHPDPNDPLTLVRGILNLNVAKPTGISSIEVELTGVLTFNPPDEIGVRRMDVPDKQTIYSSTVTVFRANQVPPGRRPASVAPKSSTTDLDVNVGHATIALSRPSSPPRRPQRRSSVSVPPGLGPTPPYTSVAQLPSPIQPRFGDLVESPVQTLDELRRALGDASEQQTWLGGLVPPSSRPHSIAFSLPSPTAHSNAPGTPNDIPQGGNSDNHTDDLAHANLSSEGSASLHSTAEDPPHVLPHQGVSSCHSSRTHSPDGIHLHMGANGRDGSSIPAGRSRLHFSLSSVLDTVIEATSRGPSKSRAVPGSEEGERGRTRVRVAAEGHGGTSALEAPECVACQMGANAPHLSNHMDHREHNLLGLGRVFGLDRDHEKEKDGEQKSKDHGGWMEFQPGAYTYPISFLLPPDLPPTLSVPHGSLNYVIRAVAHRPGTFTSKLSCQVPLILVAAPAIGAGEGGDPGPLIVEKQWKENLSYTFGLSSRLFLLGSQRHLEATRSEGSRGNTESLVGIGAEARADAAYGTIILDLTLLPLEKVKFWKLSVFVDQHIMYVDERGRPFADDNSRVKLMEVEDSCSAEEMGLVDEDKQARKNKHKKKLDITEIPLLPTPISPHRSPLLRYTPSSTDLSTLAGPGPYTLSIPLGLPGCNVPHSRDGGLHFTVKHKNLGVWVEHSLRFVMRVESIGDESGDDNEEGDKKKLFDIAVKAPINILSCRCIPEYHLLPRYSQVTEDSLQHHAACGCELNVAGPIEGGHGHDNEPHIGRIMTSRSGTSLESEIGVGHAYQQTDEPRTAHDRSRSSSHTRRNDLPSPLTPALHPYSPSQTSHARDSSWWRSSGNPYTRSHGHPGHQRSGSHQLYSISTSHVHTPSQTPISSPYTSRPPSPLAQYERLVSGLESEVGDAPPSYDSIASGY